MNWERILMEVIIASIVTGIFGVIVAILSNIFIDLRGYKKIDSKIGTLDNATLSGQHKDIKEVLSEKAGSILGKVENINAISTRNEERYKNLNVDQQKIRDNVLSLVNNWETLLRNNRELKLENERLKDIIKQQNKELKRSADREKGRER